MVAKFCREIEHVLSDSRIWRQKNSAPDCMTDAPETDASFLAQVSAACVMGISKLTIIITKPRGYAIQHIPVPAPSQDKLEGLRQEGHLK